MANKDVVDKCRAVLATPGWSFTRSDSSKSASVLPQFFAEYRTFSSDYHGVSIHHPDLDTCEWCESINRIPGWTCVGVSDGGHAGYAARVGDEGVYVFDGLGPEEEPSYISPSMFDLIVDMDEEYGPDPLA